MQTMSSTMDFITQMCNPLFYAVLCYIATLYVWELFFSPLRAFPGPRMARFTNIWQAIAAASGHIDQINIKLHRKYGSIVRIGPNTLSISDPALIPVIYATKGAWRKSDMYRPNDVLMDNGVRLSNIFNTQDNGWHDKFITPIRPLFTATKISGIEPLVDEMLNKFTSKMGDKFADDSNNGVVCMMDELLGQIAWDTTAKVSFGNAYGFIDKEGDVDNLMLDSKKGLYYFAPISQIPWLDYLLDKNPIKRIGPKPTLTGVLYAFDVVAKYKQKLASESPNADSHSAEHFLVKYLKLKEKYPEIIDDAQIVNYLMLSILAGGDTITASLCTAVYHLSKNASAYEKLMSELDAANISSPAQMQETKKLPYLDAVIREALRINPSISMVLERVVPDGGFQLPDGSAIPGGTNIGINPAVVNRDVSVFGEDVDEFNPDRWLKTDGETEEESGQRVRKMDQVVDFVFGAGSRVCLGKNLAKLVIQKVIATLYSSFNVKALRDNQQWKTHNAWFVYIEDMPMMVSRRAKL